MDKHLHIVSFNIPYPPNYGGVIDVFYKIKALRQLDFKIHLHCYHYGREEAGELEKFCENVYYYSRKSFYKSIYSHVPFIVGSRSSDELLNNLTEHKYPILFEGLHTCAHLGHPNLTERIKIVRMHNVEWDYYKSLGKAEHNFFRKFYFYTESYKLKHFEQILKQANNILAISPNDTTYMEGKYQNVTYVPAFHSNEKVTIKAGKGDFAFYHGNLSVIENNQAAFYLVEKIFKELPFKLVIAGKKPLPSLKKLVEKYEHVELIESPPFEQMLQLMMDAHINVLPTFQATGIKLKMINSLYNGRFCVVNTPMIENTGLEPLCHISDDANEMKALITKLFDETYTQEMIEKRRTILEKHFSNKANALRIKELVYPNQ